MTSPTSRTPEPASPGSTTTAAPAKPLEAEELVDEYLHRPLARVLVRALARTSMTPNQVTFLSGLLGVVGGAVVAVAARRPALLPWAGVLLFSSVVLDCCDGQLARIRGISSTTGAVLDGLADYAVGLATGLGASYYLATVHHTGWYWLLGLAGILSAAVQSFLFDHTKTRYIAQVNSGYTEREVDLERLTEERARARREGRYWDALLLLGYENYSRAQNAAHSIAASADPVAFRAANAGRMRAWTFLGIGTHFALAYLACFLAPAWPDAIAAYFLICVVPLNLYLVVLLGLEPREQPA